MIHDFTFAKEELIGYRKFCDAIGYKRASGGGSHPGGSASRNNLSMYEYIRSATFYRDNSKIAEVKKATSAMNIWDNVLVYYMLQLQPGDFLDIQDHWISLNKKDRSTKPLGKFVSVALTPNNHLNIEDKSYVVPQYHAIEFSPIQIHDIPKVEKKETWAVFMVGNYVDVSGKII
jgi:hypothetical protein